MFHITESWQRLHWKSWRVLPVMMRFLHWYDMVGLIAFPYTLLSDIGFVWSIIIMAYKDLCLFVSFISLPAICLRVFICTMWLSTTLCPSPNCLISYLLLIFFQPETVHAGLLILCWQCPFYTHKHNRVTVLCPELPGWAGTRRNIHPLTPILIIRRPLSVSILLLWSYASGFITRVA